MKRYGAQGVVAALIIWAALPVAALARDYNADPNVRVFPVPDAQKTETGLGVIGPGDMLTSPEERARLESERMERLHNPSAMDAQMDKIERNLDISAPLDGENWAF